MPLLVDSPEQEPELVVYLRHGVSLLNKVGGEKRWVPSKEAQKVLAPYSEDSLPLCDPEGYEQAAAAGAALGTMFPEGFDIAFYSDAPRTRMTLNNALDAAGFKKKPSKCRTHWLAERRSGRLFKMTWEDVVEAGLDWYPEYREREGWFYAQPPGGEANMEVMPRVAEFRRLLQRETGGKRVLIAGHGVYGMDLRVDVEGHPTNTLKSPVRHMGNCEWFTYVRDQQSGRLVLDQARSTGA